jgi:hypothetical protein
MEGVKWLRGGDTHAGTACTRIRPPSASGRVEGAAQRGDDQPLSLTAFIGTSLLQVPLASPSCKTERQEAGWNPLQQSAGFQPHPEPPDLRHRSWRLFLVASDCYAHLLHTPATERISSNSHLSKASGSARNRRRATVLTESIKQEANVIDGHRQKFAPAVMGVAHLRLPSQRWPQRSP